MKQLPAETVRLITSSQVITSVLSVIKELVENSLDANATSIDVKLENYGFDKIEVRDNGDGVKAADVPVMAVKHYTSKISSSEDLESLTTYGFRGEALGSICSTAEVLITTKSADDDFSTQYTLDRSGHIISQRPSHLGQGTTITVLKLFKNLPVRKQFYSTEKKCKEEIKKIQKLVMAYGIIKPDLRITFTHNKTVIWQKTKVPDHKTAFMAVVGALAVANMIPFQRRCEDPEVFLSGFLPKPNSDSCLTSHSDRRFVFVNNRPVHQKEILKLTQQYCNLKSGKESNRLYPVFFINIVIPSSAVDVNLTPDKSQVLLQNKESVCLAFQDVLISLYGHLPEPVSGGTKTTNDIFTNETEQANAPVNENESCGNTDFAWNNLCSFNNPQNDEIKKPTGACSKIQPSCINSPFRFPIMKEIPDNERTGCDNFQDDLDTNSFMNLDSENGSDGDLSNVCFQEAKIIEQTAIPKDYSEITADEWSLGNAFKNSKGNSIEPVRMLIPGTEQAKPPKKCDDDGPQKPQEENNNQSIKKLSAVNDKLGQITAYDLIRSQIIKKPMSAFDIFTQDYRPGLLAENIKASSEELKLKVEEMWMKLNEEEKKKYEEKANKDLERYNRQSRKAMDQRMQKSTKEGQKPHKLKLKDCHPDQQKLDKLFYSQTKKMHNNSQTIKILQVPFSMNSFRYKLHRTEQKKTDEDGRCLIHFLNVPGAWLMASDKKIMALNLYRIEEALLFKKLLENHKLPIEKLDKPVILTKSLFSDNRCIEVLCSMAKENVKPDGSSYLSDSRLVANGFKIKIIPGVSDTDNQLEIEGMANCLPYYGVSDLKEILSAVISKNAKELHECRPLKVINYLEGEAVRLSRQLPLYLSKEDVQDTICRMEKQLGNQHRSCVHGRPFFHYISDIPQNDE